MFDAALLEDFLFIDEVTGNVEIIYDNKDIDGENREVWQVKADEEATVFIEWIPNNKDEDTVECLGYFLTTRMA